MDKTKPIGVILGLLLLIATTTPAFAQTQDYSITNPYIDVDWSEVNQYKSALHTHTNASDGSITLKQSIERHIQTGFDIIATTDHGTVNYSWSEANPNSLIHGALSLVGKSEGDLVYLGTQGTFDDGTSYSLTTNKNNDDILTLGNGKQILRLPYGIENNAVSVNAHVNSWFVDYCDNTITSYEDAVYGLKKAGGVCVINHPGEYTKARGELHTSDAYNEDNLSYAYYINKFAGLIQNSPNCIGIDMNSKSDKRTRFDRKLWDILLTRFADNGENVYGICSSDAHALDVIDTGFTIILADELSSNAAEAALLNGEIIGASHCIGNYEELQDIANAVKQYYGENDVYKKLTSTLLEFDERIAAIESGELDADEEISIVYSVLDDDGYTTVDTMPEITNIIVDDKEDTITINTKDALIVRMISDGKLTATLKADNAVFDLQDYSDNLGNYVRFEVFGEGGILYTQAFLLNQAENAGNGDVVKGVYANMGVFDFLLAVFNNLFEVISRFFLTLAL